MSKVNQELIPASLASGTTVNDAYSDTSSRGEAMVWLCPVDNASWRDMGMIGYDLCDEWFHFKCVAVDRQKWYWNTPVISLCVWKN